MILKCLYVSSTGSHAPLYYFNLGKIKRIDKRIWQNIPKKNNFEFKRNRLLQLKFFRSALLKFAERLNDH